ncbi:MAG TPA: universal stress protein [Candidatus Acidoferrales bacterium]|nr:universal stress protein [Candidatus Acidoferrales bacterium]
MKVLLAIDSSEGYKNVICEAATRLWPAKTEFRILHVVDISGMGRFAALLDQEKRVSEDLVRAAAEKLAGPAGAVTTESLVGFPRTAISEYAKAWEADFVLVGSRGHGAVARFLLGSVAQAVLRTAPCSVEIVRRAASGRSAPHEGLRMLLGTDGSQSASSAAKSIASRPWPAGSQVKVVSAVELLMPENAMSISSPSPVYPASLLEEVWGDARKRAHEAVADAQKILSAAGLNVVDGESTPDGDPRVVLLDQAKSWGADLIVLGSHGRRGIDRMLMGSVSESIALHAHCSVEVIRG